MIEDCLFKSGKGSRAALEGASGEQGGAAREHRGSTGGVWGSIEGALRGSAEAQQVGA